MEAFKEFVEENSGWFSSDIKETAEDLAYYEKEIGFEFQDALKWLLIEYGYSEASGLENLSTPVMETMELRSSIDLPEGVCILVNWGDAGIVLMFGEEPQIITCRMEDLHNYAEAGGFPETVNVYNDYAAWVQYRFISENEESDY